MRVLDMYKRRLGLRDDTARDRWLHNTQAWINKKLPRSLSYHTAIIDGEERRCAILSTQNDEEKKICSMPGEALVCGTYVEWMDNVWLITQLNAPNEVYQTALMTQCNYLLKWVNDKGEIISRWSIAVDGTKYLTGEFYQPYMTVGDSRMQLTIPRDDETVLLNRGVRFLIDDPSSTQPQAYELSKINRAGNVYNGHGVFIHMLTESNFNPKTDNPELMIADYYTRIGKFAVRINNAADELNLSAGDTFQIDACVLKDNVPYENGVMSYESSAPSVATVDENGLVTAVAEGVVKITVSYLTYKQSLDVSVSGETAQSQTYISLSIPDSVDSISVGATISAVAILYKDGVTQDDAEFTVRTDCVPTVATVSITGGDLTITASRDRRNIGKSFTVTVESCDVGISRTFKVRGWT